MAQNWQKDFELDAKEEVERATRQYFKDLIRITLTRKLTDHKITKQDVALANDLLRGQKPSNFWSLVGQHGASVSFGAGVSLLFINVAAQPDDFPIGLLITLCFIVGGLFFWITPKN